jgi:hypothetical protein
MAQQREPTAAQALYGHLPSAVRPEVKQGPSKSLAETMYPAQSHDQRLWNEICNRVSKHNREALVRGLSELNARIREGR